MKKVYRWMIRSDEGRMILPSDTVHWVETPPLGLDSSTNRFDTEGSAVSYLEKALEKYKTDKRHWQPDSPYEEIYLVPVYHLNAF